MKNTAQDKNPSALTFDDIQTLRNIRLKAKHATEAAAHDLLNVAVAQQWIPYDRLQPRRIIAKPAYFKNACDTKLAYERNILHISLDCRSLGEWWIPVRRSFALDFHTIAFPYGTAIETQDVWSHVRFICWLNRIDPYFYPEYQLLEVTNLLAGEVGTSYPFFISSSNHPFEFTVKSK